MADEIPVARLHRLIHQLNHELEQSNWDRCEIVARDVLATIKLAIRPETSQAAKPHLDGVYTVGTMKYIRAPDKLQSLINRMNRIIRTAQRTLR